MDETLSPEVTPRSAAEYRTVIDQMIEEMRRLNERMQGDGAEINRLAGETAAIKSDIRSLLAEMGAPL